MDSKRRGVAPRMPGDPGVICPHCGYGLGVSSSGQTKWCSWCGADWYVWRDGAGQPVWSQGLAPMEAASPTG